MPSYHDHKGLILKENKIVISEHSVEEMHELGEQHLHAALMLCRENIHTGVQEVLAQKRQIDKKQYPDYWCFTAGGHCMESDFDPENPWSADINAISRESLEEIGLGINFSANERSYVLNDSTGQEFKVNILNLWRFQNSLHIPKLEGAHPYNEDPLFSVLAMQVRDPNLNLSFTANPDELSGLAWKPVAELRKEKLTPWFDRYLNLINHE